MAILIDDLIPEWTGTSDLQAWQPEWSGPPLVIIATSYIADEGPWHRSWGQSTLVASPLLRVRVVETLWAEPQLRSQTATTKTEPCNPAGFKLAATCALTADSSLVLDAMADALADAIADELATEYLMATGI